LITVVTPGTFTTIQDIGRKGFQRLGVPESGAMDIFSFKAGNLLVGNDHNLPSLEMTLFGPELYFEDSAVIAVTGADLSPKINGKKVKNWSTIKINPKSTLTFDGPVSNGGRGYLSINGGFSSPNLNKILGSFSTYVPANFGGYLGRPLLEGDSFINNSEKAFKNTQQLKSPPVFHDKETLRVVLGPQDDRFFDSSINELLSSEYQITPDSDRIGCRLSGPKLIHNDGPDVISDGNTFGTIQIPGSGEPIILLSDRGTTGGYTKIASVISADWSRLAQLVPGCTVKFQEVSLEQAYQFKQEEENILNSLREIPLNVPEYKIDGKKIEILSSTGESINLEKQENTKYILEVEVNKVNQEFEIEMRT
tara:strand:+ start:310 stop:1404 length:1095 start_codon:yes stop_codon:yes gene_type:complete